jgi:hypothetical protein
VCGKFQENCAVKFLRNKIAGTDMELPKPVGPLLMEPHDLQSEPAIFSHPIESPTSHPTTPKTTLNCRSTLEASLLPCTRQSPSPAPAKVLNPPVIPVEHRNLPLVLKIVYRICACISCTFFGKNLPSKIGVRLIYGILCPFDD